MYLDGMWLDMALTTDIKKKHVLERHWTTSSKDDNHRRLNCQHHWKKPI